jgi:hypothetical protein
MGGPRSFTLPRRSRIRLRAVTAIMIEMEDGAQLRTWTEGSVIPQRLPVVMVHGGPGALLARLVKPCRWELPAGGSESQVSFPGNPRVRSRTGGSPS